MNPRDIGGVAAGDEAVEVLEAVVISLPGSARLEPFTAMWAARPGLPPLRVLPAVRARNGAAGCLASHLAALTGSAGPLMVCEDDAVFSPDSFRWPLTAPADWQVLWLGGQHRHRPVPQRGWARTFDLVRTHCYIARRPRELAAAMALAPRTDPHLAALPVVQYAQTPFTVGQRAGVSTITGQERRADQYWNL